MTSSGPDKRPYEPPRMISLAMFAKNEDEMKYAIRQVLPPDAYGVDMRSYLLSEAVL